MRAFSYASVAAAAIVWYATLSSAVPLASPETVNIPQPSAVRRFTLDSFSDSFNDSPGYYPGSSLSGLPNSETYDNFLQQLSALDNEGRSTIGLIRNFEDNDDVPVPEALRTLRQATRDYESHFMDVLKNAWGPLEGKEAPGAAGWASVTHTTATPKWATQQAPNEDAETSRSLSSGMNMAGKGKRATGIWKDPSRVLRLYDVVASFYPQIVRSVTTVHSLRVKGPVNAYYNEWVNLTVLMREWNVATWVWIYETRWWLALVEELYNQPDSTT